MGKVSNEITVDEVEVDAEVDVVAAADVVDVDIVEVDFVEVVVVDVVEDLLVAGEVVIVAVGNEAGGSGFLIDIIDTTVDVEGVEDVDA